jgi:hypothetical protein
VASDSNGKTAECRRSRAGLVLSGNTLYGTTYGQEYALSWASGTIFAVNSDGTRFTNLYTFTATEPVFLPGVGPQPWRA